MRVHESGYDGKWKETVHGNLMALQVETVRSAGPQASIQKKVAWWRSSERLALQCFALICMATSKTKGHSTSLGYDLYCTSGWMCLLR